MFGLVAKGGSPDEQWAVFVQRQVLFPDAEGEVDQFQFVPLQPDLVGIAVASLAFALRRQAEDRPALWVSDLYGVQQGHADKWQVCLAHQLRNGQFAIEAGDMVFAPRMKAWLLRVCVLARRRGELAEATRRTCKRRFENDLDKIMDLSPENKQGRRLRKRYGKIRDSLLTFLEHPEIAPDNNSSERELRPTATYRKVTGGFRSDWGADLFAAIRSVVGTAARQGQNAFDAIRSTLGISCAYAGK